MGSAYSQQIAEAKEREGSDLIIENIHIKSKEIPSLTKKLLGELPHLTTIELKSCRIKKLANNISLLYNLTVISLVDNKLTTLPPEISNLHNLQEIDLSENGFTRLPMEVSTLPNLSTLTISKNQLSVLPNFQARDFTSLTTLNLDRNEFLSFPMPIVVLGSLKVLNMNYNKINHIPIEDFTRLKGLKELHFRGNQISTISKSLRIISEITHLDLSENQIKEIPVEIKLLTQLTTLELQHNQFSIIPEEIGVLEALNCLNLSDNKIVSLPVHIGNLSNLTELYLRENQIEILPSDIGKLTNLRKFYCEFNNLQTVPNELCELKKLVVLILHHNNLSTLPENISSMSSLLRFSLDDNPLDESILQIIKDEGALALVKQSKDEEEEGQKRYRSSTTKRGLRKETAQPATLKRSISIKSVGELSKSAVSKSNSLGPSKSPLVAKKSPDNNNNANAAVPSFSKFKFAFDSLLEEQDFSQKKKEVLKNLPENEKWNLLNQYKGSTLNLIKNSNNSPTPPLSTGSAKSRLLSKSNPGVQQKTAKDFIPLLKETRANKNNMEKIKQNLKQSSDWVSQFVEASGISAVFAFLRQLLIKKQQSARDLSFITDCFEIIQILLKASLKSVLTTSGAVDVITMGLYSSHNVIKVFSIDLLDTICQYQSVGAILILEALNKLSVEFEEEFRFMPLIQFLESSEVPQLSLVTCLSLINFIIDSVEELNERFQIRMEFMTMGFKDLIANFPTDILFETQRMTFEQQTENDYEDMICRKQAASDAQDLSDGKLTIALITDNVHTNFEIFAPDSTLVSDIISQIVSKYKIEAVSEYGLFDAKSTVEPSQCLPNEAMIKDCNLLSNQLEFKMKDWEFTIFLSPTGQPVTILCNPQLTTEQVIKELISSNLVSNGNYCLKMNINSVFIRVEDAKPLLSIELLRDKNNWKNLQLEETPIQLKVFLAEDTSQIMEFNLRIKISEIFQSIITHSGFSINPKDYCLILEDKTSDTTTYLDFDKTLQVYEILDTHDCSIKLIAKEESKQITNNDDDEEEIEECNIWEEPPDSIDNITFEQGKERDIQNIETATLNKLVERVTSADEYDVDFVNVFVLMFHGFTTEEKLWSKLLERFEVPNHIEEAVKMKIRARVCIFVKNWVEKDLLGEHVRSLIQTFVVTRMNDPQYALMAKVILERLNNPKGIEEMQISERPPPPVLPRNVFSKLTIFDIDDLEIARQLTLYLFTIYRKIRPRELFRSAWNKEKLKHLSQNVLAMIDYYNRISNCISTAIVMETKVRNRTKLLEKVITVAEKLRELNNFHLLSAFISAINNSAILRLKFTKSRISKKHKLTLSNLEETMSMDSSFVRYRNALSAAKPPCIPFIGVYLTDLTFIADGNPDRINRRINFVKQKFVYGVIATIKAYQATPYNLEQVDSVQQFLHNLTSLSDKEIYAQSLLIEPRNADRGDIQ